MTQIECHGLSVELDGGRMTIERKSRRLPWMIEQASTSQVVVRTPAGVEQTHPIRLNDLALRRLTTSRFQWIGEIGGAGVALEIEIDAEGIWFAVSPIGTGDHEVISVTWPGQIHFEAQSREACWGNELNGAMFRCDGKPWSFKTDLNGLRLAGFSDERDGLALIADTGLNNQLEMVDDGTGTMSVRLDFMPSMGTLAYQRKLLLVPLEEPGYVAVAKAFRPYAIKHGLWKSWRDKVDENPNLARMQGAFVACAGYFHDDGADQVSVMRTMKKMGFNKGYLFSPRFFIFGNEWNVLGMQHNALSDASIRDIQDLGYVCAPFLQVEEAGPSIGMDKFARKASGEPMLDWQVGEKKFYEIAKWRTLAMLPQFDDKLVDCMGIHFDTLMAGLQVENYGHRQYDARQDAQLKCEVAMYYRRRGKIIASEQRRDWSSHVCDLGTTKNYLPFYAKAIRHWTCPLMDLIYHDSTLHTVWDHDSYDDDNFDRSSLIWKFHPFGRELHDLLTASPPVLFPEGTLYKAPGKETPLPDGSVDFKYLRDQPATMYRKRFTDASTQAALPKALRVCRINERHGTSRMIAHRFLGDGPMVQESEFESGLHVVVNYADEAYTLPNGRTIHPHEAITEE